MRRWGVSANELVRHSSRGHLCHLPLGGGTASHSPFLPAEAPNGAGRAGLWGCKWRHKAARPGGAGRRLGAGWASGHGQTSVRLESYLVDVELFAADLN